VAPPAPTPTTPSVTNSRVETLNAANAAFRSGDLKTAAGLYDRVINTPPSGEAAALTQAINDFARFRAMVTLLADGREDEAHTHLDALQARDANAPFARLGNQLWDQYGMTGQLRGACAQLQPQIASQAGPVLTTLQASGVTVDAQTLCSVS
jgi:tetratricopeptide (TPR) repeat protein